MAVSTTPRRSGVTSSSSGRRHVSEHAIPPAPPFGNQGFKRPWNERILRSDDRVAGKIGGTDVTSGELPFGLERGVRYFCVHSDPLLRAGLAGIG
jgi:hypothetical protein